MPGAAGGAGAAGRGGFRGCFAHAAVGDDRRQCRCRAPAAAWHRSGLRACGGSACHAGPCGRPAVRGHAGARGGACHPGRSAQARLHGASAGRRAGDSGDRGAGDARQGSLSAGGRPAGQRPGAGQGCARRLSRRADRGTEGHRAQCAHPCRRHSAAGTRRDRRAPALHRRCRDGGHPASHGAGRSHRARGSNRLPRRRLPPAPPAPLRRRLQRRPLPTRRKPCRCLAPCASCLSSGSTA